MYPRLKFPAFALAALLASVAPATYADTQAAPAYKTQTEMLKTADDALATVTNAHAARLALFDDNIDAAKTRIGTAEKDFTKAEKALDKLTIGDTKDTSSTARYLPFDLSMALSEDFKPSAENKKAIKKANELMKKGSQNEAVKVLRAAAIDVNITTALLPVANVGSELKKAATLIDQGKYFEANLALKSIEDSIVTRTFSIDDIPLQGAAS